jgi:hypothetical protein
MGREVQSGGPQGKEWAQYATRAHGKLGRATVSSSTLLRI